MDNIFISSKAMKQLATLSEKKAGLEAEMKKLQDDATAGKFPGAMYHKYYFKERNALYTKMERCDSSIDQIRACGLTPAEYKKACREVLEGTHLTVSRDRGMGYSTLTVAGYSEVAADYIQVERTHWNGFMRNVQGCGRMADTTDYRMSRITKVQFDKIKEQPITVGGFFGPDRTIERKPEVTPAVEEKIVIQTEGFVQTVSQD